MAIDTRMEDLRRTLPGEVTAERVRAAFGDERFGRSQAVKRRYDPDNVFRFNHNIPPAAIG